MHEPLNRPDPDDDAGSALPAGTAEEFTTDSGAQVCCGQPADVAPHPPILQGARLVTADEAVELLVLGDHPDSESGSLGLDATLVEMLRDGTVTACQTPDGRIAFSLVAATGDRTSAA